MSIKVILLVILVHGDGFIPVLGTSLSRLPHVHPGPAESVPPPPSSPVTINHSEPDASAHSNSDSYERSSKRMLRPEAIIVNHECFAKSNMDECHYSPAGNDSSTGNGTSSSMECLWCEYWCVFKQTRTGTSGVQPFESENFFCKLFMNRRHLKQ